MIRVADYIMKTLVSKGVSHIFMLSGGGAMHLDDAIGKNSRIKYVCNHHEQACAIAAEGFSRLKGEIAVVCVTSGPGGTNTITGVLGQWLDSVPALYLSGQVRYDMTVDSTSLPLRQFGDQEANIVEIIRPITKYAVMVTDPWLIRYHLEKAIHLAVSGRPGPVWLDIPLNVQASLVEESKLKPYDPLKDADSSIPEITQEQIDIVIERLTISERPVILAGSGIRLSRSADDFFHLAEKLGIPVQVAWDAIDLFPSSHPLYAGRPGNMGQRGANFIFQNADLLISLGCRLSVRQIGYNFASTARAAYNIVVDIDPAELKKPSIQIDLPIHGDVSDFIRMLDIRLNSVQLQNKSKWLKWCNERIRRYPVVLPEYYKGNKRINPYVFFDKLSQNLGNKEVIVSSNGAACVITSLAMQIKKHQRHIVNSGCASMGYGLPAAIGACFANDKQRIICLEGDGSIQMNIQELATVAYHWLPIKIFLFSNDGYLSIRTTQNTFFKGNLVGESEKSGVGLPNYGRLAKAYGIPTFSVSTHKNLEEVIIKTLNTDGPVLCDIRMDPNIFLTPRLVSRQLPNGRMASSPLEDMYPFLEKEEFLSNMLISPWEMDV